MSDPQDFIVKNLEKMVAEKEAEIKGLKRNIDTMLYYAKIMEDLIRHSYQRIRDASEGDIKKPVLRAIGEPLENQE